MKEPATESGNWCCALFLWKFNTEGFRQAGNATSLKSYSSPVGPRVVLAWPHWTWAWHTLHPTSPQSVGVFLGSGVDCVPLPTDGVDGRRHSCFLVLGRRVFVGGILMEAEAAESWESWDVGRGGCIITTTTVNLQVTAITVLASRVSCCNLGSNVENSWVAVENPVDVEGALMMCWVCLLLDGDCAHCPQPLVMGKWWYSPTATSTTPSTPSPVWCG